MDIGSTDIIQRTVNFVLFAGIVWYLIAEPAKNFFAGRSQDIADELEKVQQRLKESKAAKDAADQKIEDAKKTAEEIMIACKKENVIINDKMAAQLDTDIKNAEKTQDTTMDLKQREMVREVVDSVIGDVLNQDDSGINKDEFSNIILKKVA